MAHLNAYRIRRLQNPLSTNGIALYAILMEYCNMIGWIEWFTVANSSLQGLSGLSRNALHLARNELTSKGYVRYRKGSGNHCGVYLIVRFDTQTDTQFDTQSDTQTDTQFDTKTQHTLGTLTKPNRNQTKPKNKPPAPLVPPEIQDEFAGFVEYRKKTNAPMTGKAITLALTELEKLAPGDFEQQRQIINQSIFRGWKGLFAIKDSSWTHSQGNARPDSPTDRVLQMIRQEEAKEHG